MEHKILFVDDESNILAGFQRQFRKKYGVSVADSGAAALKILAAEGPFDVVVSDMQMPEMNGVAFLAEASKVAPDTVRIMLTGNSDQQTATQAVNEGRIFRFLTKPCAPEMLEKTLEAALEQYRLITAEKDLLEKTLVGCVQVLTELLAKADPAGFDQARRVRDYVRETIKQFEGVARWELELAALLSPLGNPTLSGARADTSLENAAENGYRLLSRIPRLGAVATIVRYQNHFYYSRKMQKSEDGKTHTEDPGGSDLPLGSRILKILADMVKMETKGVSKTVALRAMAAQRGWYDPLVLETFRRNWGQDTVTVLGHKENKETDPELQSKNAPEPKPAPPASREPQGMDIAFEELIVGDYPLNDIYAGDGTLLLPRNTSITSELLEKLQKFAQYKGVREPIHVAVEEESAPSPKKLLQAK
jgi:response regulator RpfG family c-di-GMP phosphodiesterase